MLSLAHILLLLLIPLSLATDLPSDSALLALLESSLPLSAIAKATLISRRCLSGANLTTCCVETQPYLPFMLSWKPLFDEGMQHFTEYTRRDEGTGRPVTEYTGYHVGGLDPEGREDAFRVRLYWDSPNAQSPMQVSGADLVNVRCQWVRRPVRCDQC